MVSDTTKSRVGTALSLARNLRVSTLLRADDSFWNIDTDVELSLSHIPGFTTPVDDGKLPACWIAMTNLKSHSSVKQMDRSSLEWPGVLDVVWLSSGPARRMALQNSRITLCVSETLVF